MACSEDDETISNIPPTQPEQEDNNSSRENKDNVKLQITIGTAKFIATLQDNATAKAFKTLLPLTIVMIDHNRNEKYYDLANSLPTAANNLGTIHNGDIMLEDPEPSCFFTRRSLLRIVTLELAI